MSKIYTENFDLLGGKLIDPYSGINKITDIFIRKGRIYHSIPKEKASYKTFNIKGQIVLPGLLDLRTHSKVPGGGKSETIESLTRAAAKGGFSSILAMPNTNPYSDNPATIRYIQDRIKQTSKIKVLLTGCLTIGSQGENIAPLGSLKDVGVVAVTDCPRTSANTEIFTNAIKYAQMFGLPVIDFPQDSFLTSNRHAHQSPLSLKMGVAGNPRLAEELAVQRAILVAKHLGFPIHLSSISSSGSVSLIAQAKDANIPITSDVSGHHLLLTEDQIREYNTNAKINPPLRNEDDRLALLSGLKNNILDACTSSHEPYAEHLKNVEFDKAPSGATGLETAVLSVMEAIGEKEPFKTVATKMSTNPHKILGLEIPTLQEKSIANFVVINPGQKWIYDPNKGESLSKNSPLIKHEFSNSISMTCSEGNIAFECISANN